jgi:head-tail adaptor
MSLAAGSLNRRITIQSHGAGVEDSLGQVIGDAWAGPATTVWANMKGQTGMGVIRSSADGVSTPVNAVSFRIRYNMGFSVGMRVVDESTASVFDIIDIRHDWERHEWTDLVCRVGANDG